MKTPEQALREWVTGEFLFDPGLKPVLLSYQEFGHVCHLLGTPYPRHVAEFKNPITGSCSVDGKLDPEAHKELAIAVWAARKLVGNTTERQRIVDSFFTPRNLYRYQNLREVTEALRRRFGITPEEEDERKVQIAEELVKAVAGNPQNSG